VSKAKIFRMLDQYGETQTFRKPGASGPAAVGRSLSTCCGSERDTSAVCRQAGRIGRRDCDNFVKAVETSRPLSASERDPPFGRGGVVKVGRSGAHFLTWINAQSKLRP
jgi:hypothetical protein